MNYEIEDVHIYERKGSSRIYLSGKVDGKVYRWSTSYKSKDTNSKYYVKTNMLKVFEKLVEKNLSYRDEQYNIKNYGMKVIEDRKDKHSHDTYIEHINRLNNFILPYFPSVHISKITVDDIESWQKSLRLDPNISFDRLKRCRITFKMIMTRASGRLDFKNPFITADYPIQPKGKIDINENFKDDSLVEYYEMDEINKMIQYCEDKELLLYIYIAVFTGLRTNEIIALKRKDVVTD